VNGSGACVFVKWGKSDVLEAEKIKYKSYKDALQKLPFKLDIKYGMAAQV